MIIFVVRMLISVAYHLILLVGSKFDGLVRNNAYHICPIALEVTTETLLSPYLYQRGNNTTKSLLLNSALCLDL